MVTARIPPPAATRLLVPEPRLEAIVRERLLRELQAAARRPLAVVCAPAGFGKTTALAHWLRQSGAPHAWLSLDVHDNDPRRFVARLLAALDLALPGRFAAAERALEAGADLGDAVIPLVVNALAERAGERLAIVLDDYQLLCDAACQQVACGLIDALPTGVGVVVASRTAPPLRLGRRRAAGTLAEIAAEQLRFEIDETERLFNDSLDLELDHGQIEQIDGRVDGWAAGLALIATALAGRRDRTGFLDAVAASRESLDAYLVEEVLQALQPELRDFLCRTSILTRLSPALCEALLDDPAARELLDEVRRANLFVTALDPEGSWLRYHHLFAELLQRELQASSPQLVPILHSRAAEWFAANGLAEEAIAHASAAGDGKRAAALLFESWRALMTQWRFVTIRRIIARLPADRGELAGFCEALDTVCWALEGADLRLVMQRLDALEPLRDQPGVAPIIDRSRVSAFYGDIGRAVKDGWAAWERYPALEFRTEISGQFGMALWLAGDRKGAQEIIEPFLHEIKRPAARNWAFGTLALAAAEEGDLELAERYARRAVEATARPAGVLGSHFGHTALAEALRLKRALDQAGEQLAHAARLTSKHPTSFYHAFTLVFDAQLALTLDDRARARASARAARAIIDRYPDPGTLDTRLASVEAALDRSKNSALRGTQPTTAELRVLELLDSDLTLAQIAAQLHVSRDTVKSHTRRLYRRLGESTREDALAAAHQRGLL